MSLLARLLAADVNPNLAQLMIDACAEHQVPLDLGLAVLQAETGKTRLRPYHGANVYGHDVGACLSVTGVDVQVTEANYFAYLACVEAGGKRNGVGPMQITHYSLQDEAGPRLWDPAVSVPFGIAHLGRLLRAPSTTADAQRLGKTAEWVTLRRWNGKDSYADRAVTYIPAWAAVVAEPTPIPDPEEEPVPQVLVVQMGHVGRPPNPGSVGTAREQDNAKAAANAVVRHVHGKGGWLVSVVPADPGSAAYRGDAFVALHCDGSTSTASRGASLGHQTPEGKAFAQAVRAAYEAGGWTGGWKPDNYTAALGGYYGVRAAVQAGNRRAFIFEQATTTNPEDRALLEAADGSGYDRVGRAIAVALGIATTTEGVDLLADERNALLSLYTSTYFGNGSGAPYANGPSILAQHHFTRATQEAHGQALAAILNAVTGQNTANWDDVVTAAREGGVEGGKVGAREAVEQYVVPTLRPLLIEVLGEDNEAQADEVLLRLGEKLIEKATAA